MLHQLAKENKNKKTKNFVGGTQSDYIILLKVGL